MAFLQGGFISAASVRRLSPLMVLLAAIGLVLTTGLSAQDKQLFGKVSFPLGDVQIQVAQAPDWAKATMNHEVFVGDKIKTAVKSRAEITLNGGGKFRVAEKSEVLLTEAKITGLKKDFGATVTRGQVWVAAKAAFGETKNVAVRTPTAVAAIRGTKYRAVAGEEESSILVYDGKVDVNWAQAVDQEQDTQQGDAGGPIRLIQPQEIAAPEEVPGPYEVSLEDWISIVEGMQINVRADGKYHMFEFDQTTDAELDFVRWNKERDAEQNE
ncbi:MAG: FecR family protein [Candidatus Neomarinimicrobiota bacterium]